MCKDWLIVSNLFNYFHIQLCFNRLGWIDENKVNRTHFTLIELNKSKKCVPRPDIQHIWWYGERLWGFKQKIGPTGIWEEKGVLWQCDDTHQNSGEICPAKKYNLNHSAERSKRKEKWRTIVVGVTGFKLTIFMFSLIRWSCNLVNVLFEVLLTCVPKDFVRRCFVAENKSNSRKSASMPFQTLSRISQEWSGAEQNPSVRNLVSPYRMYRICQVPSKFQLQRFRRSRPKPF